MNRKTFFITIVTVCAVLIAAEIGVIIGIYRKGRKKDEKKSDVTPSITVTEAPTGTVITDPAPPTVSSKPYENFTPTPTPEAWVDRFELYPGDPRIEGTEEGYRDVWRVTEQRFYTMNEMFFWIEPRTYMEEPFMWSKDIDLHTAQASQMNSVLDGLISYDYDPRGNLLSRKEELCIMYDWAPDEYTFTYDALFSPYVTIDYGGVRYPYPSLGHRYSYDTKGRVIHEWTEKQEGCTYSEGIYPEYKYYYGDDGRLALREAYSETGELKESLWMNYTMDEQGRIAVYSEIVSNTRSLIKEYLYDDNGILTEVRESYRGEDQYANRDVMKQYNDNGELIGKKIDFLLANNYTESGYTVVDTYEFGSEINNDGQRICKFTLEDVDSYEGEYHRTYEYDTAGNVTARTTYTPDGLLLYREEISYELFNVPISKLTEEERIKLKMYR